MNSKESVMGLIQKRKARHALPRELYLEPEVYRQDLEQIWHKDWVFAGHTFEIEKPGQYFTLQVGDYPVAVVMGKDGQVRAFHNACRHRGAKVCEHSHGKVAKMVCPYHKWTFELDGNLLYAGNMGADFDKTQYGLKTVHCQIVHTYIYICVAERAPDFDAFRQAVSPFIGPHRLENCKVAFESNLVEKGNWKLVFENNRECFHCEGTHPELLNSFVENLSVAGVGGEDDPELLEHWQRCETAGMPSRLVMDPERPLSHDAHPVVCRCCQLHHGRQASSSRTTRSKREPNIGALLYFNYPSTWNHFLGDHALSFRVLPMGPGETLVTTKWLVPKDAVEGVDYDLDRLTKVWLATNDQDRRLVEGTQAGISSPTYEPGPFSEIAENGVCQFDDWYCETMLNRLQDPIPLKSVG